MANTADTSKSGKFIQVTYTGSGADWNYATDGGFSDAIKVKSIQWVPTGADTLVINDAGIDGASIVHIKASAATDFRQVTFGDRGTRMKPYIDLTDCTFTGITSTKIIFELA